jgi:mevalonate kinase
MRASAPGKIILFGEHAVVYGRHALVSAVNLRCYVEVRRSESGETTISSYLGRTGLDFNVHPYVSYAIRRFSEIKSIGGVDVRIESNIPVASGLGSSAAVSVATIAALNAEFNAGLEKEDIFEMAKQVEIDVQGRASGIDPFVSTYGGCWLFPEKKKVKIPFSFFLVNISEKSTAEMVARVAELRERYPEVIEHIFDAIDEIVLEAFRIVRDDRNTGRIDELISINQSLLRAVGVSTPEIDSVIAELETQDFKAKITGAGGGGCIVGIAKSSGKSLPDLSKYKVLRVEHEMEGVRIESEL